MRYMVLLFMPLIFSQNVIGQMQDALTFHASKRVSEDSSFEKYQIIIKNKGDSIAFILHSMFLGLSFDYPQNLALPEGSLENQQYSLHYSARDTFYTYESTFYRSSIVLPYQTLIFDVIFKKNNNLPNKISSLRVEYFFKYDLCYRDHVKSMKKITSWYRDYTIRQKVIDLR